MPPRPKKIKLGHVLDVTLEELHSLQRSGLKDLLDAQDVADKDLQPRNMVNVKALGPKRSLAMVYNAFKCHLLTKEQLANLTSKMATKPVGQCDIVDGYGKQGHARPRGLQLSVEYRYGFFSTAKDKPSSTVTFEQTHVILFSLGVYPPTSEHEVSHRCHNPFCVSSRITSAGRPTWKTWIGRDADTHEPFPALAVIVSFPCVTMSRNVCERFLACKRLKLVKIL